MIEWNKVTWYSKLGAIILFLGVVPALCFYIGTQYELARQPAMNPISDVQVTSTTLESVPNVAGYYISPYFTQDLTYIQVTQSGGQIAVKGFATHPTLSGSENVGDLAATTTISKNGTAQIDLSESPVVFGPCIMYLNFYHVPSYPDKSPNVMNYLHVYQTNAGFDCGFGNNVSFDLGKFFYEKQDQVPDNLPRGK